MIERVSDQTDLEGTLYLPRCRVVRREKSATKVRIVFHGWAKHSNEFLSITDCLEMGPNLVRHLFDVLIKFRGFATGIVSDAEKAFHQVKIEPGDRRMLRGFFCSLMTLRVNNL